MTYSEKLKDPRWQKLRLEVLERDQWKCRLCGDPKTTLHVHHEKYHSDPWDTPLDLLVTYCQHCHSVVEWNKKQEASFVALKVFKYELTTGATQLIFVYLNQDNDQYVDVFHWTENELRYRCSLTIPKLKLILSVFDSLGN